MPVYESVAFEFENARNIQRAFEGRDPSHTYSRITNPTLEHFEQKVRIVSDALGVIAVSSGMGAISKTIMALAENGSHIVTTRYLFGNTVSLLEKTLKPWGLETRYVDMTDPLSIEGAIDKDTSAIFFEAITNPQLEVADAAQVSEIGKKHDIPVILDATATTPYLFRAKEFGINIEVISSTKYISGGGTSVGGLIIDYGTFDWSKTKGLSEHVRKVGPFAFLWRLRTEAYRNLGACLSPHNASLQILGLETLGLRIERSCSSALEIARFLEGEPKIKSVNYPGLKTSPFHEVSKKQFRNRFGAHPAGHQHQRQPHPHPAPGLNDLLRVFGAGETRDERPGLLAQIVCRHRRCGGYH
jgi:O-acetylhomoserine (thiol)-lyase